MIALLLLAALHATPAPSVDSEPYTHAQSRVDIGDGRHMNLYCIGTGSPAVIFDSGLGVGSGTLPWSHVQPYVAQFTRACSYDRAGYGFSDPGPLPRTSDAVVSDLHALLVRAGVPPPYVLVAHAIAGLYEPLFADRYPAEVAGMVLVDPSAPGQEELFASQYPKYAAYREQQLTKLQECADDTARKQCQLPSRSASQRRAQRRDTNDCAHADGLEGRRIRTREHRCRRRRSRRRLAWLRDDAADRAHVHAGRSGIPDVDGCKRHAGRHRAGRVDCLARSARGAIITRCELRDCRRRSRHSGRQAQRGDRSHPASYGAYPDAGETVVCGLGITNEPANARTAKIAIVTKTLTRPKRSPMCPKAGAAIPPTVFASPSVTPEAIPMRLRQIFLTEDDQHAGREPERNAEQRREQNGKRSDSESAPV